MTTLGLVDAVRMGREDAEHAAGRLTPADLLAWSDDQAQIAAAAAEARNAALAAQHRAAAHTARRIAANVMAVRPSLAPPQSFSAGRAVGDVAALATGFAAGVVLNARYPEGVNLAGVRFKAAIPLGVVSAVGGVAVKRLWGMRRTGRALVAGGIGSGLACLRSKGA
jgi:hypothetical protein